MDEGLRLQVDGTYMRVHMAGDKRDICQQVCDADSSSGISEEAEYDLPSCDSDVCGASTGDAEVDCQIKIQSLLLTITRGVGTRMQFSSVTL